ncbi:hypothetical protein K435DRAFT_776805 [Dendrothele bispora CBS 962.96]|uniref:Uncharacterized protein n=1 Tax=Dendrothele bispora (strain CBS 962.96) TaxID=1314807 RepID=A0A4S8MCB7_DENBC|nr:hypothetical protein K435DRAFT_776805 [Dendrothele bispora CBS 962.96]
MDQVHQSNRLSALSLIWNTTSMYLTICLLIPVMLFKRWFSLSSKASSRVGISSGDTSIPQMKARLSRIDDKRDSSGPPMAESHHESGGISSGQTMIAPGSQNQTHESEDIDHKNKKNQ